MGISNYIVEYQNNNSKPQYISIDGTTVKIDTTLLSDNGMSLKGTKDTLKIIAQLDNGFEFAEHTFDVEFYDSCDTNPAELYEY